MTRAIDPKLPVITANPALESRHWTPTPSITATSPMAAVVFRPIRLAATVRAFVNIDRGAFQTVCADLVRMNSRTQGDASLTNEDSGRAYLPLTTNSPVPSSLHKLVTLMSMEPVNTSFCSISTDAMV